MSLWRRRDGSWPGYLERERGGGGVAGIKLHGSFASYNDLGQIKHSYSHKFLLPFYKLCDVQKCSGRRCQRPTVSPVAVYVIMYNKL